jgi:hypothetical protein
MAFSITCCCGSPLFHIDQYVIVSAALIVIEDSSAIQNKNISAEKYLFFTTRIPPFVQSNSFTSLTLSNVLIKLVSTFHPLRLKLLFTVED